jgi:nitrogen fixation/metabolism regulation signal transduction histidine kinase
MRNKLYFIQVAIRVVCITLTGAALSWFYLHTQKPATMIFILILLIVQMIGLVYFHTRTLRNLSDFLGYLQESDFTLAFSRKHHYKNFQGIGEQLELINQKLQGARLETERQFQYLQAVIKQVDTGIIAYDQEGRIVLLNRAARELLGLNSVIHIDYIRRKFPEFSVVLSNESRISYTPVRLNVNGNDYVLAMKTSSIKVKDKRIRLLSFQNIRHELEASEQDAWRRLIRIQRHEIINSITPITTLTTAIKRNLTEGGNRKRVSDLTENQMDDVFASVEVIEERSQGLIEFMEHFRNLTDVPVLQKEKFRLGFLFDQVTRLYAQELNAKNTLIESRTVPDDLSMVADVRLLEQVIINLVKNSLEAMERKGGRITLTASGISGNLICIHVVDNGCGISEKYMDSIFVPSFTTKEQGSGIGLSIARQFILMHNGTIAASSKPGEETGFEIILPDGREEANQ